MFKKGYIPFNKGKKLSTEHKAAIKLGSIGSINAGKFKKGQKGWSAGTVGLLHNPLKGKKMPEAWRQKLCKPKSITYKGEKNHSWKGGDFARKDRMLIKQYGITLKQYQDLFISQDNRCGICGKYQEKNPSRSQVFHLDHDHASGKVRGILCQPCNLGLGLFKDNIQTLENTVSYLKKHQINE